MIDLNISSSLCIGPIMWYTFDGWAAPQSGDYRFGNKNEGERYNWAL